MPISAKEYNRLKRIQQNNEKWAKDENYKPSNRKPKAWNIKNLEKREIDKDISDLNI